MQELKRQLRIEHSEDDSLLSGYITAAREYAELLTGNLFLTQRWQIALDSFADIIELEQRPLQSVDSIQYTDPDGALQTLSTSVYEVDNWGFLARIYRAFGQAWPETRDKKNAILINATFGDKQPSERVKHAIMLISGGWYEHREDISEGNYSTIPHGAMRLLSLENNRRF